MPTPYVNPPAASNHTIPILLSVIAIAVLVIVWFLIWGQDWLALREYCQFQAQDGLVSSNTYDLCMAGYQT